MRNYEFTVIFDANEESTAKGLETILAEFASASVEIVKQDDMGVRNLAYLIKKQDNWAQITVYCIFILFSHNTTNKFN